MLGKILVLVEPVNVDFIITAAAFLPSIFIQLDFIFTVGTSDRHSDGRHGLLLSRLSLLLLKYTGNRLLSYNQVVGFACPNNDIILYQNHFPGKRF